MHCIQREPQQPEKIKLYIDYKKAKEKQNNYEEKNSKPLKNVCSHSNTTCNTLYGCDVAKNKKRRSDLQSSHNK